MWRWTKVIWVKHSALCLATAAAAKSLQSCPTLCDPIDGSPPGSPAPGILQARTLEWVTISFSNAWKWRVKVKSCLTLSDPMDYSLPGSSIHRIFQARVLEWGAIAFSGLAARKALIIGSYNTLNIHWKDWCWSSNTLATRCEEQTHWKRPWCWERLRAEGEGNDRWDGWMSSPTQWTWVWANSGRWWRTGKPDMLCSMGRKE